MKILYLENDMCIGNFFLGLFQTYSFTFHHINQLSCFENYLSLNIDTTDNFLVIANAQFDDKDMCSYMMYVRSEFNLKLPTIIYSSDNIIDTASRTSKMGMDYFFPLPVLPYDVINCIYDIQNAVSLDENTKKSQTYKNHTHISCLDCDDTIKTKGISRLFKEYLDTYFSSHSDFDPASGLLMRILNEIEPQIILSSLKYTNGNRIKAADILGINRNTLRKKMTQYNIDTLELLHDA